MHTNIPTLVHLRAETLRAETIGALSDPKRTRPPPTSTNYAALPLAAAQMQQLQNTDLVFWPQA